MWQIRSPVDTLFRSIDTDSSTEGVSWTFSSPPPHSFTVTPDPDNAGQRLQVCVMLVQYKPARRLWGDGEPVPIIPMLCIAGAYGVCYFL